MSQHIWHESRRDDLDQVAQVWLLMGGKGSTDANKILQIAMQATDRIEVPKNFSDTTYSQVSVLLPSQTPDVAKTLAALALSDADSETQALFEDKNINYTEKRALLVLFLQNPQVKSPQMARNLQHNHIPAQPVRKGQVSEDTAAQAPSDHHIEATLQNTRLPHTHKSTPHNPRKAAVKKHNFGKYLRYYKAAQQNYTQAVGTQINAVAQRQGQKMAQQSQPTGTSTIASRAKKRTKWGLWATVAGTIGISI